MRAIDSNVLVRLIARDDAKQLKAAEQFVEKGGWVSVLALAETTWVLASVYERSPAEMTTAIEMLLKHRSISLQDSEIISSNTGHNYVRIARRAPQRPTGDSSFKPSVGGVNTSPVSVTANAPSTGGRPWTE